MPGSALNLFFLDREISSCTLMQLKKYFELTVPTRGMVHLGIINSLWLNCWRQNSIYCLRNRLDTNEVVCSVLFYSQGDSSNQNLLQVNLFQKYLFLHQLTHNMTNDCPLNYQFSTWKFQAQNMERTWGEHVNNMFSTCSPHVLPMF